MDGGEVLRGARRQRTIELGQRPSRGQLLGALDQRSLQLASQVALELPQAVAIQRRRLLLTLGDGWRWLTRLQPERAPDPLHVDTDDARPLALATEGGDREPSEVAHLGVRAFGDRPADDLSKLVEVEPVTALEAALSLADPALEGLTLRCSEEEAVEDQLEDAAIVRRLRERRRQRLAEVGPILPGDGRERCEAVEHLRGADRHPFLAQLLTEGEDLRGQPFRERWRIGHAVSCPASRRRRRWPAAKARSRAVRRPGQRPGRYRSGA